MIPKLRAAVFLIFFTPSLSAFLPNEARKLKRFRTFLSVSTTEVQVHVTSKRTDHRPRFNPNSKDSQEFQWLNWVYCQWRSSKPGELDEKVLKQMAPAITRWGRRKTREGADRAEELLERIIEENLAGNDNAELTLTLFNTAMDAHTKVGNPDGVQRILQRMHQLRKEHPRLTYLQPDVFSMSTLATAWAKRRSPEAAKKAEAILEYMEVRELPPNTITYNAVLNALAYGKEVDKALRIEDLVNRMKARSEAGEDSEPDIYSYQSLIQAWSKTKLPGSPQKAEQILLFLDEEFEKGKKKLKPNSYCFTSTIHAWARSKEKEKARNAYQIFNHMKKRYFESRSLALKPNVVVFTAVLNACAWPENESEKADAFEIAQLTMEELSLGAFDKPNFLSFAAFLCVCFSTLPPGDERDQIIRNTFEQCIEKGQVAGIVLEKLSSASPDLYHELTDVYRNKNGVLELPYSWKAKVKGERKVDSVSASTAKPTIANLDPSSKLRLKEIERFRGKSGAYSGKAKIHAEFEGIEWSQTTFGNR